MRQRFSPQQWAQWMDEFEIGDQSVTEFCRRKRVSQNAFYNWRRKLGRPTQSPQAGLGPTETFVPVALATDDQVVIELPGKILLRVNNSPESLQPVLNTLMQIQQQRP